MRYEKSNSIDKYFKSIRHLNPLTKEEESELATEIQKGCKKSLNKLIEHNLKIVVTIANKNMGRGIQVDDLIQQGNIGLLEAGVRFKPNSGIRFASFASTRILKLMNHLIDQCGRVVRIPVNQEYERYLSLKRGEEVENIKPVLLDDFIKGDQNKTMEDIIFLDIESDSGEDINVETYMSILNDREREVINRTYGLTDKRMTQKEIAEILGVSNVTISNIKKRAINKMKKLHKIKLNTYE